MAKRARRYTNTAGKTYIRLPYDESKGWIDNSTRRISERAAREMGLGKITGRPKGSKDFSRRDRLYTAKEARQLFQNIKKGFVVSGSIAQQLGSQNIAGAILQRVHDASKFNIYSGNLSYAYRAIIVTGRKARQVVYISDIDRIQRGNVDENTETGARSATLQKQRHIIRAGRSSSAKRNKFREYVKPKNKRYLKRWEQSNGYVGRGIHSLNKKQTFSFGYIKDGKATGFKTQSAIIIENIAPYADMVQRRYNTVLARGISAKTGGYGAKLKGLYRIVTIDVLRIAGFNVK